MDNNEFEKLWETNRDKILANDSDYQRILKSYTAWTWADYIIFIGGFIICEQFMPSISESIVLQYLLALAGMILIWLGYRLLRSQLIGKKTLQQAEQEAKERYRQSLH
jgi:hypothetical protein